MAAINNATAYNITSSCDAMSIGAVTTMMAGVVLIMIVTIACIRVEIAQGVRLLDFGPDKVLTAFENILG
jgi:hypothetical protein